MFPLLFPSYSGSHGVGVYLFVLPSHLMGADDVATPLADLTMFVTVYRVIYQEWSQTIGRWPMFTDLSTIPSVHNPGKYLPENWYNTPKPCVCKMIFILAMAALVRSSRHVSLILDDLQQPHLKVRRSVNTFNLTEHDNIWSGPNESDDLSLLPVIFAHSGFQTGSICAYHSMFLFFAAKCIVCYPFN